MSNQATFAHLYSQYAWAEGMRAPWFARWRARLRLTQPEAAMLLGMSLNAYCALEKGLTRPRKTTAIACVALARIAGAEIDLMHPPAAHGGVASNAEI